MGLFQGKLYYALNPFIQSYSLVDPEGVQGGGGGGSLEFLSPFFNIILKGNNCETK